MAKKVMVTFDKNLSDCHLECEIKMLEVATGVEQSFVLLISVTLALLLIVVRMDLSLTATSNVTLNATKTRILNEFEMHTTI